MPLMKNQKSCDNRSETAWVHPLALCESAQVGPGTRVWAFAQVMKGAIIGQNCNIGGHAYIEAGARIGDRVTIKNQALIWNGVTLEDDVFVGPGVTFTNDRYPRSPRMEEVRERYADEGRWLLKTHVGRGASLSARCTILPGTSIGRFAVVGAGALVTHDVPDYALVIGVPGRIVGRVCLCGKPQDQERVCAASGGESCHGKDDAMIQSRPPGWMPCAAG